MASFLQSMAGVRSDDVIYLYLPLYHSAGFLMGLCGSIEKGDVIIRKYEFGSSANKRSRHGFQWEMMLKVCAASFSRHHSRFAP